MIDLKLTPQQSDPATMLGAPVENNGAQYPHGTTLKLEGETLKRLAFGDGNLPQVGDKFMVIGEAEVVEVCKENGQIEAGYCVELQMTTIDLQAPAGEVSDPQADKLYTS